MSCPSYHHHRPSLALKWNNEELKSKLNRELILNFHQRYFVHQLRQAKIGLEYIEQVFKKILKCGFELDYAY